MAKDILNQNIKKIGKVDIKNTAYAEGMKRTNIEFSNLDSNTAVLEFQITKDNVPAVITKKNAYIYAYFKSNDGNAREAKEVDYTNAMNGIVSVQLDKDFLKAVTGQRVYGELYVTLHQWNEGSPDFSDTVVLTKFDFKVKDALINQISGVTKTEYIRMFDELRDKVKERMNEMEDDIGKITELKQDITNLITKSTSDIEKLSKNTIKEINDASASNLNEVDSKLKNAKLEIDDSINIYKENVEHIKDDFQTFIDSNEFITTAEFENFREEIIELTKLSSNDIEAIKKELKDNISQEIDNKINDLNWQKHALTKEDGALYEYDFKDKEDEFLSLENGIYYVTNVPIDKDQTSQAGFVFVGSRDDEDAVKNIVFTPYNSTQLFLKRYYKNWKDWEKINDEISETGWKDITLENGVKAYSSDRKPQYKITSIGGSKLISIRGAVTNITKNGVTVGSIPLSLSYPEYFPQATSTKKDKDGRSYTPYNKWVVATNGKLRLEVFDFDEKDIIGNEFNIINHTFQV